MSSATSPLPQENETIGRVSALENQYRTLLDSQAQTLAEIRALREDFRQYTAGVAEELQRVYKAITKK